jgi:hypothetical protein
MPNKRADQKNNLADLADLAELHNDPGSARGQDFTVNADPERVKHAKDAVKDSAKKDKGKSKLTGEGAPRPNRAAPFNADAPRGK